jgi:hypothetical protein
MVAQEWHDRPDLTLPTLRLLPIRYGADGAHRVFPFNEPVSLRILRRARKPGRISIRMRRTLGKPQIKDMQGTANKGTENDAVDADILQIAPDRPFQLVTEGARVL